jgi:hypothetical protein
VDSGASEKSWSNADFFNRNMSGSNAGTPTNEGFSLARPFGSVSNRSGTPTGAQGDPTSPAVLRVEDVSPANSRGRTQSRDGSAEVGTPVRCINPASEINSRLDTQVEVRVYPCNNSQGGGKKKFTTFNIKPEVSLVGESLSERRFS